jgi:biotin carboxyl carrier protein
MDAPRPSASAPRPPGGAGGAAAAAEDPILAALRALLPELEHSGVVALEVTAGEARLTLRRRAGQAPIFAVAGAAHAAGAAAADEDLVPITTPLSGVFYATPAPDEPAYVNEGDEVEAGQIVGLVEAMKVFNEIHAEVPGTIVRVNVTQGTLVQSGQTLMLIRPSEAAAAGSAQGEAV